MILFTNKKTDRFRLLLILTTVSLFTGRVAAQCDYSDDFTTLPAPTNTAYQTTDTIKTATTSGWIFRKSWTVIGKTGSTSVTRTQYKALYTGEEGVALNGGSSTYRGFTKTPLLANGCDSIFFNYTVYTANKAMKVEFSIEKNGVSVWKDTLKTTPATAHARYQCGIGKIGITGACYLKITNISDLISGYNYPFTIWNVCIQKVSKITTPAFTVVGKTNSQNLYSGSAKIAIACKTQGVSIYYTTDGTAPTTASTLYTDSINLTTTTRVKAIATYGDLISDMADTLVTFADETAPTVPTDLTGTPSQTSIDLSWTASTDNIGVTGYNIYANGELQGTVIGTGYTLSELTPATEYVVDVEAFDAAGNKSAKATTTISTLSVTTNLSEPENNEISVYPNPIKDYVNVSITENSHAIITDLSGKILISTVLNAGNNRVNTSALPSGVFLLKVDNKVNKLMK